MAHVIDDRNNSTHYNGHNILYMIHPCKTEGNDEDFAMTDEKQGKVGTIMIISSML